MKKLILKSIVVVFCSTCIFSNSLAQRQELTEEQKLLEIMHKISSNDLYNYVEALCDEEFEGRLCGSEGYNKSADWLIEQYKNIGLKPMGDKNSYLHKFPHQYTEVFKGSEVNLHINNKDSEIVKKYDYFLEFVPGSTSGNGEVTAEVIYAGYGITAPELGYDDYKGIDVKGKIVAVEREAPVGPANDESLFLKWRKYTFHQNRLLNAVEHGAAGMLYNYGPIANPNNAYSEGFIYSHVGPKVMEDLFSGTGKNHIETVKKINDELIPQSFNTKKIVTIKNNTKHHSNASGSNVIGYIEGSDPELKNEFIIIGGHLDHMGYCHDLIPGANDNASAVAVMLEVAKALSKLELKRSLMFMAIGAEEQSLMGIQHFLQNPPIPKEKMVGFINLESVGTGDKISVGFGKNYPDLFKFFEDANEKYIHRIMRGQFSKNLARPRQDAVFFDWEGIPTISFGTYGTNYDFPTYHVPNDNMGIIEEEIMEDLAQLVFMAVAEMANKNELVIKRGEGRKF